MDEKKDLLVEIGTEELPPKALTLLAEAFALGIRSQLEHAKLRYGELRHYASPRRLAVLVSELDRAQAEQRVERKGPALKAAFDASGGPTKAAEGFARSCGVSVAALETQETAKGAWLVFRQVEPGQTTVELVPDIVRRALADLPIPKRMRWGEGEEEFVRPVHWVLLLFGDQVLETQILGLATDRLTYGHRFHHPGPLPVSRPEEYEALLRQEGRVYADMAQRREIIRGQVESLALKANLRAQIDPQLLDEVTALVEWPNAMMGGFDAEFLEIPAEVLIQTMQAHQKYFPVQDDEGRLQPFFITVSNIVSQDPDQVRAGNERVIRPRFADAAFFWRQDLKHPLESYTEALKAVVFQNQLGTVYEKSQRISLLARAIAQQLGADPSVYMRAADLCKCDLMTKMVGEFPGLQGTMGRYYAEKSGEAPTVAAAMEEQYLPRHAGDRLPETDCGRAIAIADKLDTLLGIFAIGQRPSGVKDPFGLRRAALGVLRILIETPLDLDLESMLQSGGAALAAKVDATTAVTEVFDYMMERLNAYYTEQGIQPDVIDAVTARRPTLPSDFDRRVRAVAAFRRLPEAESLASANKRIRNILRKTEDVFADTPDASLFSEVAEKRLSEQIARLTDNTEPLFSAGRYKEALTQLAALRESVDRFFDDVMVMTEEDQVRRNRLALLNSLSNLFLRTADLSRLQ